jgi:hypothetical protein
MSFQGHKDEEAKAIQVEALTEHKEAVQNTLATKEVSYDQSGVGALLRAPYVFGAALLASMGGFSFGYGTSMHPSIHAREIDSIADDLGTDQGVISLILVMPQFHDQFPRTASTLAS